MRGAFAKKSLSQVRRDEATHGLNRVLGPFGLVFLGIGCTVGAGIYVLPGNVAANFAGPAVVLSFVVAGVAAAFTALCYAELASALPAAGSAYTYCYAAIGRGFAFGLGWLLLFEFGVAACTLAVGFSGYLASLLRGFGIEMPIDISQSLVQSIDRGADFRVTGHLDLVAGAAIVAVALLLRWGVADLSRVNIGLVLIKFAVISLFIIISLGAAVPHNWLPLIPANEGGFHYGWPGIFRGASILFFAYLGFEVVAYAASESRNPQRDLPIGILGSLAVCAVIYVLVGAAMTGAVPYRELGVPDPLALVVDRLGRPRLAFLVKCGALAGLSSVLLINGYGQSRLAFTMSRDGLLPPYFSQLHQAHRTPARGIVVLGAITLVAAVTLPLSILNDLVSVGTAFAFSIVALSLMWLRSTQPDMPRPFRVPFGGIRLGRAWLGIVPLASIAFSWLMIVPAGIDVVNHALNGHFLPISILGLYLAAGVFMYRRLAARLEEPPAKPVLS